MLLRLFLTSVLSICGFASLARAGVVVCVCYSEFPGSSCSGVETPFHRPTLVGPAPSTESRDAEYEFGAGCHRFVDVEPGDYVVQGDGCNPFGCFVGTPVTVGESDVFVQVRQVPIPTATSSPTAPFTPTPTRTAALGEGDGCHVGPGGGGSSGLIGAALMWLGSRRAARWARRH